MQKDNSRKISILRNMRQSAIPSGAVYLSEELDIPQASAGRLLLQMEAEGLVEKVNGKGRIISQKGIDYLAQYDRINDRVQTAASLAHMYDSNAGISKERLLEIMDVRTVLEVMSVELACRNGTEEDFKELDRLLLEYKLDLANGGMGGEQNRRLHLGIARASGNHILYVLCALLLEEKDDYAQDSSFKGNIYIIQTQQHEAIVEAIKRRDEAAARQAIQEHLHQVRDHIGLDY